MRKKVIVLIIALWLSASSDAEERERYSPSTPTTSPYIFLEGSGGFAGWGGYYSFVRPARQLQRQRVIQRQRGQELQQLESSIRSPAPTVITGSRAGYFVFGTQDPYRNYGGFYSQPIRRRGRRQR